MKLYKVAALWLLLVIAAACGGPETITPIWSNKTEYGGAKHPIESTNSGARVAPPCCVSCEDRSGGKTMETVTALEPPSYADNWTQAPSEGDEVKAEDVKGLAQ